MLDFWSEVERMSGGDDAVMDRVAEAEGLLTGLAVLGSESHAALVAMEAARRTGHVIGESVVLRTIEAVSNQARLTLTAGGRLIRSTPDPPHWLASTAYEWRRYVRWLVGTHEALASEIAALPDQARLGALQRWERAGEECRSARQAWAGVGTEWPRAGRPLPPPTQDLLDTVVSGGRVYVDVDDLSTSLHQRARAFADAARTSAAAGDDLGELVSDLVAEELVSRADALVVAGMDQENGVPLPPTGPG